MRRFRVWWAMVLIRGTGLRIVRQGVVNDLRRRCDELDAYVDRSGALQSPHRIRAYRRVRGETAAARELAQQITVD